MRPVGALQRGAAPPYAQLYAHFPYHMTTDNEGCVFVYSASSGPNPTNDITFINVPMAAAGGSAPNTATEFAKLTLLDANAPGQTNAGYETCAWLQPGGSVLVRRRAQVGGKALRDHEFASCSAGSCTSFSAAAPADAVLGYVKL